MLLEVEMSQEEVLFPGTSIIKNGQTNETKPKYKTQKPIAP